FTRGSWNSSERDRNGLERTPRDLLVEGSDLLSIDTTVYRWADLP
ncbi:MAG: phosphonate ABC transporter ATP-binding protein, partial [Candidatus Eremiobacteraeota bacterium]|nr:phosphonate ABC transporter ATP-binding protein [Candidatus Eremiobacteraeota bacterium]